MTSAPSGGPLPGAVLFDMDGLLVETESLWYVAERDLVTRLGGRWDSADSEALVGGPIDRAVDAMLGVLGDGHDRDVLTAQLMHGMETLLRSERVHWRPGAHDLLLALRDVGVPCALVSASYRALVDAVFDAVLHEVGEGAFRTSVAGDELPRTKPFPDPYLHAAAQLGVEPRRCVVLEDSEIGSTAGLATGALVVGVPLVGTLEPRDGLVVVDSLADLTPTLLGEWSHAWAAVEATPR